MLRLLLPSSSDVTMHARRTALICLVLATAGEAPAQSLGTFHSTGALTRPRQFHTATLLTNGRVLIAGGYGLPDGWHVWSSAELYDPSSGTFTAAGEMTAPRYFHTSTVLADGKVLITGGNSDIAGGCFCKPVATAELYDPATGVFTEVGPMSAARSKHTATLLNNGKVLITGGAANLNLANADLYDPLTRTFRPTSPMRAARWGHTATLLTSGKVLIDGGHDWDESEPRPTAELFEADAEMFIASGRSSITGLRPSTATLLPNGKVLFALFPCCDPATVAELYDPATESFAATREMSRPRMYATGTLLPDGKVLIAGRDDRGGSAEVYDPSTGRFNTTPDLVFAREEGHTATLLPDGTVLMAGGWVCCGRTIASAEIYRPTAPVPSPTLLTRSLDGRGQGAILHAGTIQLASADNRARSGQILEVYMTGLSDDSSIPPQIAIGGRMAQVLWFGSAPGFQRLNQVNVRVPTGIERSEAVPVRLFYLGRPSNQVTIGVQ